MPKIEAHEKKSRAVSALPQPETSQDSHAEQPDVPKQPADLRAHDSGVRRLGPAQEPRLAFNRTVSLSRYRIHLSRTSTEMR